MNLIEQIYKEINGDTVAINDLDVYDNNYSTYGEFAEEAMLDDLERARDIGALVRTI